MKKIGFLSNMNPSDAVSAISRFSKEYVQDWKTWITISSSEDYRDSFIIKNLGAILRGCQATRPRPMRRPRAEATHAPPYLDDLVTSAIPNLETLKQTSIRDTDNFTSQQINALESLWFIFYDLAYREHASCVGITKAIMLLSQGRIGPAFDKNVCKSIQIPFSRVPKLPTVWLEYLMAIGHDLRAFENQNQTQIESLIPPNIRPINVGRVYDMIAWGAAQKLSV